MKIDEMTIGQARELARMFSGAPLYDVTAPWEIGAIYLIRTVTMIDLGRLVEVTASELVIEDAAWIADTGRFADALKSCDFGEIEPFPDGRVIVGRGCIIDAVKMPAVKRSQK